MNRFVFNPRTKAFTMVEMLIVIAIIGILAALLLPVLNQGQQRAKIAFCGNSLEQIGLAFHTFANDHGGKFPTALSTNDGGTLEYVQEGFNSGGIFYTAYRHFQALSNELVKPDILACPADLMRSAASNFPALQNINLSYFIDVNGTFDKPASLLAGDRNLATNSYYQDTIMGIGPGSRLHWTWEVHRLKGNALFADGHVEGWNNVNLINGANGLPGQENLFLPSVLPALTSASGGSGYSSSSDSGSGQNSGSSTSHNPNQNPGTQPSSQTWVQPPMHPSGSSPMAQPAPMSENSQPAMNQSGRTFPVQANQASSITTTGADYQTAPPVAAAVPSVNTDSGMSTFDRRLLKRLQSTFEWLYLLLLLLLLLYIAYRIRKKLYGRRDS